MKYLYKCEQCNETVTINKSMSESSKKEYCKCNNEMIRVFQSPMISTADGCKQ